MRSKWPLLFVVPTVMGSTLAAASLQAPASAANTPMRVTVHDITVGSRTVAHARLRDVTSCAPYGVCRTTPQEGTIRWTLISKRDPDVQVHHRSVVEDGRVRWRTPRLKVPGQWYVRAAYSGSEARPASNSASVFRVTRP